MSNDEDNLTPNQYTEIRKKKLEEQRKEGVNPYPHKVCPYYISVKVIPSVMISLGMFAYQGHSDKFGMTERPRQGRMPLLSSQKIESL